MRTVDGICKIRSVLEMFQDHSNCF